MRKPPFPSLSRLQQIPALREENRAAVDAARRKIFGYETGLPGEKQWLKPLEGRKMMKWYWPSKYLMADFQVDQYFQVQANRFAPRDEHPSVAQLQRCLRLAFALRRRLDVFFGSLSPRLFLSHPSLQDLYSLYRSLGCQDSLRFKVGEEVFQENGFCWFDVHPFQGIAIIEKQLGATEEGRRSFKSFLNECRDALSVRQLHRRVVEQLQSSDSSEQLMGDFVRLRTSDVLRFPRLRETMVAEAERSTENRLDEAEGGTGADVVAAGGDDVDTNLTETEKWLVELGRSARSGGSASSAAEAEERLRREIREEKLAELLEALEQSPELRNYFTTRHRFFDPSYRRRRLSFLDRLSRNRIKSEKAKTLYAGKHFVEHPDRKEVWPDNKGLITRRWPSPYH